MTNRIRDLQQTIDEAPYTNDDGERLLQEIAKHTASFLSTADDGHVDDENNDGGDGNDALDIDGHNHDRTSSQQQQSNHLLSAARTLLNSMHDVFQRKQEARRLLAAAVTMTESDDPVQIDRAIEVSATVQLDLLLLLLFLLFFFLLLLCIYIHICTIYEYRISHIPFNPLPILLLLPLDPTLSLSEPHLTTISLTFVFVLLPIFFVRTITVQHCSWSSHQPIYGKCIPQK